MKLILAVLSLCVLAQATIDWSNVKPRHIDPKLIPRRPLNRIPSPRITGGEEVEPNSLPYQVALFVEMGGQTYFCGGSVLNSKTILTAAHCVDGATSATVILGAHKVRDEAEPTQVRLTSNKFTVHSEWNALLLTNDIALIHVDEITFNENIQPVILPTSNSNTYVEDMATVSGWGLTSDSATTISEVLNKVTIQIIYNVLCDVYYLGRILDGHICGSGEGGKSTCSGDSGGPLVASTGEQIGIVSFGIALGCEIGWPPAFTRVSYYLDWIQENAS